MVRLSPSAALLGACLAVAGPARSGETPCWFEGGVVVVPAVVGGVEGDFVLDTGTARTTLHETRAQAEGMAEAPPPAWVQLAGVRGGLDTPAAVADLDVRTWNLPTPVAGVIGADVLRAWVLEVTYAPCRVRVWRAGRAPALRGRTLALGWDLGRPTVAARVTDDSHEISGRFVVATGMNAPLRLADDLARVPGATPPDELYPDGVWLARLAGVTFAGRTGRGVAAGLMPPEGEAVGVLGGEVLAHFRLRFDFPAGRLIVAPAR